MNPGKRALWRRFIEIAQPYFFPNVRGGRWATLLLMSMLLVFLFALLAIVVAGIALAVDHLAPAVAEEIASGMLSLITGALHSGVWLIALAFLAVPALVFAAFRHRLRGRCQPWLLLAVVLLLSLSVTGINVAFSYISNYFTTALVKKNQDMAYLFVAVYFGGFLVGIPIVAFYGYVQNYLGMRWRAWLTGEFLGNYFKNRSYYEIETRGEIDNPDQRIMEDIRSFTRTSLTFLLVILGSLMDLVSFVGILWSKSIPLVGVVLGYSLVGTALTVLLGRRLVRLNFNQLRYEADFRYSLVHARDNAESIAFYQGERPEVARISDRFRDVLGNFNLLIGWQRNLSFFTTAYSYLPVVLPYLILFPLYFGGQIEYGDMVQANFAFTQVYAALSLIVSQIEQITNFAAGVDRLSTFADAIAPDQVTVPGITSREADRFAMDHMTLLTPDRARTLVTDLTVDPGRQDNLVIVGQSGVGKSSLLRALAGLWTQGAGVVERPPLSQIFFLPQKPYMILGSLRDQLLYPRQDREVSAEEMRSALAMMRLEDLPQRVGGFDVELDWADVLSLGEQQRLAFARLLINKPAFAVLDEATSALDPDNEANLYRRLKEMGIRYISVGHRRSLLDYHERVLELQGPDRWRWLTVDEYRAATGLVH
jgi:vitamin B12/bleomycin/antimicrobial peptide transport system ATP-binding/permease protein